MKRLLISLILNGALFAAGFLYVSGTPAVTEGDKEIVLSLSALEAVQPIQEEAPATQGIPPMAEPAPEQKTPREAEPLKKTAPAAPPEPSDQGERPPEEEAAEPVEQREETTQETETTEAAESCQTPAETIPSSEESSTVASASAPQSTGQADYEQQVMAAIARCKLYPSPAQDRQQEGSVRLRVVIDEKGKLVDCLVMETSGYQLLDKGALKSVQRAAPFPDPPASREEVVIQFYMDFELN